MKIYDIIFLIAVVLGITTLNAEGATIRALITGAIAGAYITMRLLKR